MDITYLPVANGFIYIAVVVVWLTRRVLSWRFSVTIDAHLCLGLVEGSIGKVGKPEIMNTDQGSQFTLAEFTGLITDNGIKFSMGGTGAW